MNKNRSSTFVRTALATIALAVSALSGAAHAAPDPMTTATGGKLASGDRTFVTMAAISDMTEIQASKLAQTNGSSQAVKDFGQQMITDHGKTTAELTTILGPKSVTPPAHVDKSHEKDLDKLSKLSGNDFDKAYAKQMVSDHKTAVSLFEKESKSGKDADLQAFAAKNLPTLQGHLKMAQDLANAK